MLGLQLDAGTILSLQNFIPGRRFSYNDDPFRRTEQLRQDARVEMNVNQDVQVTADERRHIARTKVSESHVTNPTFGARTNGVQSLGVPLMIRG